MTSNAGYLCRALVYNYVLIGQWIPLLQ
uniref:Transposase n=1 Tax=Heterorhabditis bacteriophora TaxID=37862 RepID=A0A1I7WC51_HETBA